MKKKHEEEARQQAEETKKLRAEMARQRAETEAAMKRAELLDPAKRS